MTSRARPRLVFAVLLGAAVSWLGPGSARAAPSVWAVARDPALGEREALLAAVDSIWAKWMAKRGEDRSLGPLIQMRDLLESGGAEHSVDPRLRMRFATVIEEEAELGGLPRAEVKRAIERAANLYRSIGKSETAAPPDRAEAWSRLAICLAHLGQPAEEIKAYDEALALQSDIAGRARLLANRAEANMVLGDLTPAIQGYRAALAELSQGPSLWVAALAPTTLWGLAVAEDRSGDLTAALQSVRMARGYDPSDRQIDNGREWFFVPDYDEAWYHAIGHWSAARGATLDAVRAEYYGRAIAAWEDYIARAAPDDHWLLLAKARLALCTKEAARSSTHRATRIRAHPPSDPRPPVRPH